MREKKEYIIVTFSSTTEAMGFEAECEKRCLPGRMIPTPQSVSAGCGLVWRLTEEEWDKNYWEGLPFSRKIKILL